MQSWAEPAHRAFPVELHAASSTDLASLFYLPLQLLCHTHSPTSYLSASAAALYHILLLSISFFPLSVRLLFENPLPS